MGEHRLERRALSSRCRRRWTRPQGRASTWGPGKYDPRHHAFDGTNIIPLNSLSLPVVIPPIYGLKDVGFETYTGDGPISYWNSYVGVSQMGGHGNFMTRASICSSSRSPDLVTPKLGALLAYQLSLRTPETAETQLRSAGRATVAGDCSATKRGCASCHRGPNFTDVLSGPDGTCPSCTSRPRVGTEPVYATRSATGKYRTTPLRALWQHAPYFHDGSAADLPAVVEHYDRQFGLKLTAAQKADLVEFLKSLVAGW